MPTSPPGPTASGSQGWSEAYVFLKHGDDGPTPQFARRLLRLMEAPAEPA